MGLTRLANHVYLADGLFYPASAFPVFGKERRGIRLDFNDIAGFMGIGTAPFQKMTKLVRRHVAIPVSRRTDPDTGLRFAVGPLVQDDARSMRLTRDHGRDNPPVRQVSDRGRRRPS